MSPKDRHNFLLIRILLSLPISETQEDHGSGISQSYSQKTISPESDAGERFEALVREFLKKKRTKINCFEDVVHNHVKFEAGTDVNLTRSKKNDRTAVGLAASSGPPHEDCFSLTG